MRRLYPEELALLEKEFIAFLVMEGIDAPEWVKIKEQDVEKASGYIDRFSQVYFTSSIAQIKYLYQATLSERNALACYDNSYVIISIDHERKLIGHKDGAYVEGRHDFIFKHLEQGYLPDDGSRFKELALIFAEQGV